MMKKLVIGIFVFISLLLVSAPSPEFEAAMTDYCQIPPYITGGVSPNIMLGVDASGSMSYFAYKIASEGQHRTCSNNPSMECDDNNDCARNYCSNDLGERCDNNGDCEHGGTCVAPPAGGVCQAQSSSTPYGYCSTSLTTSCRLNTDCPAGETCIPRAVYEGYFRPDKNYVKGTCSNSSSTTCEVNSDCGAGNTCNLINGGIYYEFIPTGQACVTNYTYLCNTSGGSGCSATKPADSLTTCNAGRYYCSRGAQTYDYQCRAGTGSCTGATTTRPANAFNTCASPTPYYCTNRRTAHPTSSATGDCGRTTSGNLLNYDHMERIDLLRWAMTGGSPSTCTSSDFGKCDPRVYNDSGMTATGKVGTVCKDNQQLNSTGTVTGRGCILMTNNGSQVSVPWSGRIDEGLAFQFENLSVQPRMGAMFYDGTQVKPNYVYVGDFTTANSRSANYPFQNLLTEVNATDPGGYTPTGPAMWDIFNYYRQTAAEYGGIPPQSGSGDRWKNPMYSCPDKGGANCNFIPCSKNFVLLMSDGLWNQGGGPPASNTCSINTGYELHSADPVVPSYLMHYGFTNASAEGTPTTNVTGVYTVGLFISVEGQKALENTAIYGSFDNTGKTYPYTPTSWPSDRTNYPGKQAGDPTNCAITSSGAACPSNQGTGSNCNSVPASSADWDKDANGVADTFFYADDALAIRNKILNAVLEMISKVSSGTAASVLASGEESGANMLQAVFYPKRSFSSGSADWIGTLQNLWFYIDPLFNASSIREDTVQDSILHLQNDYVTRYYFDPDSQTTMADLLKDVNGDYTSLTPQGTVEIDKLKNLWEAGKLLWQRDISTDPRNIKTYIGEKDISLKPVLEDFSAASRTALRPYLQAATDAESEAIIRYINGEDTSAYRSREVGIDLNGDNDALDLGEEPKVWKLGDIISSTPKVSSWVPVNTYDLVYNDDSYATFACRDKTKPCASEYDKRGRVFTGANDGMLHAFKLGTLELKSDPDWTPAAFEEARVINQDTLNPCSTGDAERCGSEIWAFIPKHVLPYLKYNAETGYCHLFHVDGVPYIFDASIGGAAGVEKETDGTSWRSVLIGSMKQGGACREAGSGCTNCVKSPALPVADAALITADGNDATKLGMSSYFAIDITDIDPANWKLLWEFSDENIPVLERADGGLGFSTSGPAVVRIDPATCQNSGGGNIDEKKKCNGEWFVAIPSGPTGKINTSTNQFMGRSDQPLKVFVIDLRTGEYKTAIDTFNGAAINYAFSGNAVESVVDPDNDYQDDALYFGYTNSANNVDDNTWTNGGVVRILTKESSDPGEWVGSKLMENIGAVTAAVGRLEDTNINKLWTYFGTGRYYFGALDDTSTQRRIYGVKDPCYLSSYNNVAANVSYNLACATTVSAAALNNATTVPAPSASADDEGWYIDLDPLDSAYNAERVTTDPVASTIGAVFFPTFKPAAAICSYGGKTHLWAVKYDTGGAVANILRGRALIQVSTGSIEEIDLKTAFDETPLGGSNPDSKDDRRTGEMVGKSADGSGLILLTAPPPREKVIHMREK